MLQQISDQDAGQLFCISISDFELHGEASLVQMQMQVCQLDLPGRSKLSPGLQESLPELVPLKILFGNPEKTSPNVRAHLLKQG